MKCVKKRELAQNTKQGNNTTEFAEHSDTDDSICKSSDRSRGQCKENPSASSLSLFGNFARCSSVGPSSKSFANFELHLITKSQCFIAVAFQEENCYVCNEKLTSCRTKLTFKTKFTSTAVFEILGKNIRLFYVN